MKLLKFLKRKMIKRVSAVIIICLFVLTMTKPVYAGSVINQFFSDNESSTENNFSASTLFFDLTDTADNPLSSPYFDFSNMIPGSSQTKTVRVRKEGIEDFKYNFSYSKIAGEDELCNALKIEAKLEGMTIYNGKLLTLNFDPKPVISSAGVDQWEIKIYLEDSSSELKNKACSFDLTVSGWQMDSDGSWGFKDSHSVNNLVLTKDWESSEGDTPSLSLTQSDSDNSATLDPEISDNSDLENSEGGTLISPTPTTAPVAEEQQNSETNQTEETQSDDNQEAVE
jgi:hypothetical protein